MPAAGRRAIGFRTADLVVRKLGIEPTAMIRVRAGISFALAEATGEGHCGLLLGELTVRFEGRDVAYGFGELDELVRVYPITIHKAQGSEYPAVVIPLTTQHYAMLARNLLYTGVTRGKRLVVLVGQRRALTVAVKNRNTRRRWSRLREWMALRVV